MCDTIWKSWKTCSKTRPHASRNELANLLLPLDELGLTTICGSYAPAPKTVCQLLIRGSSLNSKGLLAQCYHRYTKMKQNKNSLVIIWQRDCHIFTKDLSNFQQHQPITILKRRFRSNGIEGDKRWKEEKGPNERKKIHTFVL